MSKCILSPFIDDKYLNRRNDSLIQIKKINLTKNLKSSKISLSEKNIKTPKIPFSQNSRQDYNKSIRRLIPNKYIKYNYLKNYKQVLNNYNFNIYHNYSSQINNNKNRNENSFSFNFNKNSQRTFLCGQAKNVSEESNIDDSKVNNENNKNQSCIIKNKNNFNDSYQNLKLVHNNNLYDKININKQNREMKINKIINSLLNPPKKVDKANSKIFNSLIKKDIKNKYPKEKMIDPIHYIKYNFQKYPMDKSLYKGINNLIKEVGKNENNKRAELNMIKRARDISNRKIETDHLKVPNSENNLYKQKYEDMINQTKHYESFHFNRNNYLNNKLRKYSPYQSILDRTYKIYLDKEFGEKRNDFNLSYLNNDKRKINLESNNISEYIPFDTKVNNILKFSKQTEKNVNLKSKEHEKMINNINKIINSY